MKTLKSLKVFEQEVNSLNQIQLKNVKGGSTETRWVVSCSGGCEDRDEESRTYNPMTGVYGLWIFVKRTSMSAIC